ncbi:hypothetical protein DY000_02025634 [Brassica cretica]|uniref:Uncharacterized protein n=1 Tax=Brassica cretica TaxID=69181 RepID=A0ABQ7EFE8_BRACR|nr:hypothetical protein DY000_02025634 [Brassica cretica]
MSLLPLSVSQVYPYSESAATSLCIFNYGTAHIDTMGKRNLSSLFPISNLHLKTWSFNLCCFSHVM